MKLSSFFICLAFALPYYCVAQINVDTIPKNVNVIEVVTGLSMVENYTLAGQALAEKGWEIAQANKEFGQIVTGRIKGDKLDTYYKFVILAKIDRIKITGEFTFQNLQLPGIVMPETSTGIITNYGSKGGNSKKAFISMLDLAQKIAPPGSKLIFSKAE